MNRYSFKEIKVGTQESFVVKITMKDMERFCEMTGDVNPLHCDKEYSLKQGFEERIVYGMLTASYLSTLVGVYLPGERSLMQSVEINFIKPVYPNDTLKIKGEVIDKNELFKVLNIKLEILNSKNEKVIRGKIQVGVLE